MMLSAANTIIDMKVRLINGYDYYGFANDAEFVAALTISNINTELLDLVPKIGRTEYDRISALDKVGLTTTQNFIYWAEIYFSMSRFVVDVDAVQVQSVRGTGHSTSVGDVSESISGGTSVSGYKSAAGAYRKIAISYMIQAGYNLMQLARCGVPTEGEYNVDGRNG